MGDFIKWLSGLSKDSGSVAGGKGANLAEMYNAKFPVPAAFVVTVEAFNFFIKETKIEDKIKEILNKIDVDNTYELTRRAQDIRELVIATEMPQRLRSEILEAYDEFNVDLKDLQSSPGALAILKSARDSIFVSVRSSATTEDLNDASFAGQQESFINVKGNEEVVEKVKRVFASVFTARSIFYRRKKGFESFVGIAAIVQKMINSDKSGVIFSRHPVNNSEDILIEAAFGQGEGIVSGKIKPDQYTVSWKFEITSEMISDKKLAVIRTAGGQTKTVQLTPEKSTQRVLKTHEIKALAEYAVRLEDYFKKPQDIEFAIEADEVFILQTRPMTALERRATGEHEFDGRLLTQGLAASPGVASGTVKVVREMSDLAKVKEGDVIATTMTTPDMVVTMKKACAIVTSEGGITAHAAIVSREMGIPAVVGAEDCLGVLEDGMAVTVDGYNGRVYAGRAENKTVEILPIVPTKTKVKVMVDLPQFAERAAKTGADGVGLIRLEGMIASGGKHPLAYESENNLEEYTRIIANGLKIIADTFIGKPIWVRTTDIRSDEYSHLHGAPKETERNPMLGNHGIRFSLKHPEIFKAELLAIKELADKGHKFGIILPNVISVDEVKAAKAILKKIKANVAFGVMIETPSACIVIKDICEEGVDFVSFGTNDLTQYTLAIDRGNEDVQYIYDEMNWAVLKQISRVIRECKSHKVETSICGQAASKPEMVEYLVKQGIDSVTVNADAAKKISEVIAKLEIENIEGTKKEENVNLASKIIGEKQVGVKQESKKVEVEKVEEQKEDILKDEKAETEKKMEKIFDEQKNKEAEKVAVEKAKKDMKKIVSDELSVEPNDMIEEENVKEEPAKSAEENVNEKEEEKKKGFIEKIFG